MLTKPTKKEKLLFLHFSFCMDCVFVIGMLNSEILEAEFIFVLNYVQRLSPLIRDKNKRGSVFFNQLTPGSTKDFQNLQLLL